MADLTAEEITDLYLSVQKIGSVVEKAYKGHALTVSTQFGSFSFVVFAKKKNDILFYFHSDVGI